MPNMTTNILQSLGSRQKTSHRIMPPVRLCYSGAKLRRIADMETGKGSGKDHGVGRTVEVGTVQIRYDATVY